MWTGRRWPTWLPSGLRGGDRPSYGLRPSPSALNPPFFLRTEYDRSKDRAWYRAQGMPRAPPWVLPRPRGSVDTLRALVPPRGITCGMHEYQLWYHVYLLLRYYRIPASSESPC